MHENVPQREVEENGDETDDDFNFNDSDYSLGEDDDLIFEQNVTENIELDSRKQIIEVNEANESDSLEHPPSDELQSVFSGSDEDVLQYPEFNAEKEMENPELILGKKFRSREEFKAAAKNFSINNRFVVRFPVNDRDRVKATCKGNNCPWRVWASKLSEESTWQIKSYEWTHTCSRAWKNRSVSSTWLAKRYIETFKIAPKWDLNLFKASVLKDYGVEVSNTIAWRARRHAKVFLRGSLVEEFGLLGSYAAEVRRTNPGTTIILSLDESVFKGIYVCFDACKRGFLAGCRPVICIDGCFLKGSFGGQLLSAVGIDGNDCIFPIAFAVIESENNATWSWFLKLLGEDLSIQNSFGLTFMSDRQKGLENIVSDLFPLAEHRFCVRHMYANFFKAEFKGLTLRDYLWRAARSTYMAEYKYWLDKLEKQNKDAWLWLVKKPAEQWSKSHFQTISKCDILLNNLCESFNNSIREARGKDILALLQALQVKLMERMYRRREKMERTEAEICPKALKKFEHNMEESFSWRAVYNGGTQYQVSGPYTDGQFVVDVQRRTCACRKWDLTGLPCAHAIASIREWGKNPLHFVDECYKVSVYMRAYQYSIYPINGPKMWPPSGAQPVKPPSWVNKKRGRKSEVRRKGVEEAAMAREKKKRMDKNGNGRLKMKCSVCGERGHNKRYHSNIQAENQRSFVGDAQESSTRAKNSEGLLSQVNVFKSPESCIGVDDQVTNKFGETSGMEGMPSFYSQPVSFSAALNVNQPQFFSQHASSTAPTVLRSKEKLKRKTTAPKRRLITKESISSTPIQSAWENLMESKPSWEN